MDVGFGDLTYTVRSYQRKVNGKLILKNVNGIFKSGQVSAIMGPSGAGKSSLLNALSRYESSGFKGSFLVNGVPRNEDEFQKQSCYLTQEDILPPLMNVEECMMFAANLKLPLMLSLEKKQMVIDSILTELDLCKQKNTRTEKLSGGQKKRLAIALELVNNPPVFFLDEPTTGLDNVSSKYCVKILKKLSQQGRTIICTIHQPSATLLELFDRVYILAQGQCIYQGSPNGMVPFLDSIGLPCPKTYAPCDYIIEVCDGQPDVIASLSRAVKNGGSTVIDQGVAVPNGDMSRVCNEKENPSKKAVVYNCHQNGDVRGLGSDIIPTIQIPEKKNSKSYDYYSLANSNLFPNNVSMWQFKRMYYQFYYIFHRMMLQIFRNKTGLKLMLVHHIGCSIASGVLFFQMGNDAAFIYSQVRFLLCMLVFFAYTNVLIPILYFPLELKLVKKEHFNRWYDLAPYYAALTMSKIPLMVVFSSIYTTIIYYLVGFPMDLHRFLIFQLTGNLVANTSEALGLSIGSLFSITNGGIIGPSLMGAYLGLASYKIDSAFEIAPLMQRTLDLTFMRSGLYSFVLAMFGLERAPMDCSEDYCYFQNPDKGLKFLNMVGVSLWSELGFLVLSLVFFRLFAFLCLKIRFSVSGLG